VGSSVRVQRRTLRGLLIAALVVTAAFAVWSWFRPYAWNVDPGARCEVIGTQIRKDRAFFWVEVHLKVRTGQTHDLIKPVLLRNAAGREFEPADTTFAMDQGGGKSEMWVKFWLESGDLEGALSLRINDGTLVIKENPGIPDLGQSNIAYYVTNHW
jgi:hypothetical protein